MNKGLIRPALILGLQVVSLIAMVQLSRELKRRNEIDMKLHPIVTRPDGTWYFKEHEDLFERHERTGKLIP